MPILLNNNIIGSVMNWLVLTLLIDYSALCSFCNSRESVYNTAAIKVHTASQTLTAQ